jgi:hypothetical protein
VLLVIAESRQILHQRGELESAVGELRFDLAPRCGGQLGAFGGPVGHHRQLSAVVADLHQRFERGAERNRLHAVEAEAESGLVRNISAARERCRKRPRWPSNERPTRDRRALWKNFLREVFCALLIIASSPLREFTPATASSNLPREANLHAHARDLNNSRDFVAIENSS